MDFIYTKEQIAHWFTHVEHSHDQGQRLTKIHDSARALALEFLEVLPVGSQETKLALDNLQEAVLWANTAVSRGGEK